MWLFPHQRLHCFFSVLSHSVPHQPFVPHLHFSQCFHPHVSYCYPLYIFFSFLLSLFFVPCFCQSGPGEQGPEQRKDLSDLSDSESGQNGPERD